MADLEKIIAAIEKAKKQSEENGLDRIIVPFKETDMILALLKEQEAVKPILEQDSMVCGVCGHEVIWQKMLGDGILVDETLDYCPHCGRAVKWE
jgi:hypothetical protein